MFHLALIHPQIPPNTGNVIRLASNSGATLHLVEPLGFFLDEKSLRRSRLDYQDLSKVIIHPNFEAMIEYHQQHILPNYPQSRFNLFSTKGQQYYHQNTFQAGDFLIFGSETKGLDARLLSQFESNVYKIPMMPQNRSLNLANSVAIVLYEALRQNDFDGFNLNSPKPTQN